MASGGKFGRSQINASDALYDFPCNPCAKDGKNMEAIFQCMDCQIFYCHRCVTGHNKFTENHNVLDKTSKLFGQGQRQPGSFSSNELPTNLCEEHHGQVIQMFCGQHDTVCCTICIAMKHRSCEGVEFIPNIAKGLLKKQDKHKTKSSLKKVKDDLQNLKTKMQNELKKLNLQRDGILDDIQKFKRDFIAKIEELERNSIKAVQDKHKEIADEIITSNRKIDGMLKEVENHLDKLKQFNKSKNEAQRFVDIKTGEEKISEGNDCARLASEKRMETLVFGVNNSVMTCLHDVQSLGKLQIVKDDAGPKRSLSYIEKKNSGTRPQFYCKICMKMFENERQLIGHDCLRKSSSYRENKTRPQNTAKPFKCRDCGKMFETEQRLLLHDLNCYN